MLLEEKKLLKALHKREIMPLLEAMAILKPNMTCILFTPENSCKSFVILYHLRLLSFTNVRVLPGIQPHSWL